MFDRIRNAFLLLRRFPQLLILPVVLWLSDFPLRLILSSWTVDGSSIPVPGVNGFVQTDLPSLTAYAVFFTILSAFLQAGQVQGVLNAFADQRPTWTEYWSATRRYGLRLIGMGVLFILMLIFGGLFASMIFYLLKVVGTLLAALCSAGAMAVYGLAQLLLIRDDLSGGNALGAAWRFLWSNRGPVGSQVLVIFLCALAVAGVSAVIRLVPGGTAVGQLLSNLVSGLLPLILFADLLRTYPVPPPTTPPPSPF